MKYFFLAENWTTGRVWEFGGLWDERTHKRGPHLSKQPLYIQENGENLWLYQAEEAILMIEVMPEDQAHPTIGQVVLKRLLSAEQVIERLCHETVFHPEPAATTQPQYAEGMTSASSRPQPISSQEQLVQVS